NLHPAVLECAAIGVPSELGDEDVKLAAVLQPGAGLAAGELVTFCEERLPRFMVPRYVEFVEALPRTPTGKIAKYQLRDAGDQGITPATWDREQDGRARPGGETSVAAGRRAGGKAGGPT
ncbi:MAG: AMP-binding enzyme, partial [Streptomycetales bacterium]